MNKLLFPFIIILLILQTKVYGQEKIFNFDDELCRYQGFYDNEKYTEDQLRDTYKLVQGYFSIYAEEELQLEDNYKNAMSELANLKIAKSPYFQALKDSIFNFIEMTYQIKKVEFDAVNGNKGGLLKHYQEIAAVKLYSQALFKGGEELMKAYEHLTKEQMKNNDSPERLWNQYINNSKSKQAQELAFKRVLTYGWWNAVNHQLPHVNFDGTQFEEFQKLFSRVETIDCDEI